MSPDSLQLALTTKPLVYIDLPEKNSTESSYSATLKLIFECRIFIFRMLKSNIEVRQDTTEFLATTALSIYIIWLRLELKCFLFTQFFSMLIYQVVYLRMWEELEI